MKIKPIYLFAVILLVFGIFSYFNSFESLENNLQDSLIQSADPVDTNIKIISIDDESLEKLGRWPWPRAYYADLISKLSEGRPAVIGVDIILSDETTNPEDDARLAESIKACGNVVLPVYGDFEKYTSLDNMNAINMTEPLDVLKEVSHTGHINTFADRDGVVRKALLYFNFEGKQVSSFSWEIYRLYKRNTEGIEPGLEHVPLTGGNRFNIDFAQGPGEFESIPFHSVLNGDVPPEYFEGSIVLVGPYTVGIAKDMYFTPLDHQEPMYGVEIHANIIQALLYRSFKQDVSPVLSILLLIIFCIAGYLIFSRLSPSISAIVMLAICIVYILLSKLIYKNGNIMQLFYPVALIIVSYLVMLAYRYIEELLERKRVTDVFGKYVAPQIVDQILLKGEEGLKLGGTRREITTLFVDIRGFTPMSEKCQPEEVVEILNDYLNLTASSIFKYGGTLDKFIGDATMAIFNAPLDLEDHAFMAVQTAWAMKQGSEPLRKELEEKFGRSVQFGIGINTGHAVVGNIGAKFRMDYTAIGDTVNTAARLESNAKPGQILLSQSTYERVKDRIKATPLGGLKVKGKEQEIEIYQLEGILVQTS
ncbi:MAG: CHASE2 domain-containing protein [Acetivibrionales bacterium]